jgi:hypothetical protein
MGWNLGCSSVRASALRLYTGSYAQVITRQRLGYKGLDPCALHPYVLEAGPNKHEYFRIIGLTGAE